MSIKTFPEEWQIMTSAEKQEWADLSRSTKNSMKATASALAKNGRPVGELRRFAIAQAFIDMGKTRSKKVETVERQLFVGSSGKAA